MLDICESSSVTIFIAYIFVVQFIILGFLVWDSLSPPMSKKADLVCSLLCVFFGLVVPLMLCGYAIIQLLN